MNYTKCWLAYPTICREQERTLTVHSDFDGPVAQNGVKELTLGLKGLYDMGLEPVTENGADASIRLVRKDGIHPEGYAVQARGGKAVVASSGERGVLYGIFALLRQLQTVQCAWDDLDWEEEKTPSNPMRMFNHWDNLTGDIERGYSGQSFFFRDNEIIIDQRTVDYARMAASVGINATVINNVNVKGAAVELISPRYYKPLRDMQEIFAGYGIDLYFCIEFAAPILLGGLDTADPCDDRVKAWWTDKAAEVWQALPGLGGFMVKADSEGRPGPFTYGRNHADGANMLADAVAPQGGKIIWRCFVYDCQQDWRDTKTDRARACYDHYMPLDGQFRDNVILQIKNGPMDFQVREPVSPLFGGLKHTNMMLEVQVAQEYTGQQRHVCYLIPWFRQVLDQDLYCQEGPSTVADLVSGRSYGNALGGMAAVTNTGDDPNWTGHDLAAANLYGFGRLSYDTSLTGEAIAAEWVRLTYGKEPKVEDTLTDILMKSWPAYESYTAPLGIGWMVNPNHHYGPNVDGYEYAQWGTYHRADWKGLGVDRTSRGTGYCQQYAPKLANLYENLETCPDELVLFFHHLPYTYVLKSGKTVIQHIYDTHFAGAEQAAEFLRQIEELEPLLEPEVYERLHARFSHQKEHSCQWRDVINTYFYRKSGIPDAQGRKIYA
ncbi:MAG: alpha-glucuronidase [Clostridiales bacterium]|nr:alpha-glucuronidase [Clostridiales bacterium]